MEGKCIFVTAQLSSPCCKAKCHHFGRADAGILLPPWGVERDSGQAWHILLLRVLFSEESTSGIQYRAQMSPRIGPNLFRTQRKFSLNWTPKRNEALRAALNAPLSDRLGVNGKLQLLQTSKTGFPSQNGHLCLTAQYQYPLIKPLHVFLGAPQLPHAATGKKRCYKQLSSAVFVFFKAQRKLNGYLWGKTSEQRQSQRFLVNVTGVFSIPLDSSNRAGQPPSRIQLSSVIDHSEIYSCFMP